MLKKIIKFLLKKLSRLIYLIYIIIDFIIPVEIKSKTKSKSILKSKLKLKEKLDDSLANETYNYFKEYFEKSVLFENVLEIREYAIKSSLINDKNKEYYYLEFGVFKGSSSNFFSKFVNRLYCFDSFEGLKEDWAGTSDAKGTFNLDKKIPKLNLNINPIVGWVEGTLDDFLKKHNPKINFVHFDMDTYSPTKFTLEKIKPYLVKNAILIFDELYHFHGWKEGEFKALKEVFNENEFEYKAFNIIGKISVVQIK